MRRYETGSITQSYHGQCEDRVAILETKERLVIAVADGAGRQGAGAKAAKAVIREITLAAPDVWDALDWCEVLQHMDNHIHVGQSTAVVITIAPDGLYGASVGDSQAWFVDEDDIVDLTRHQRRKPLLGTGQARPVGLTCDDFLGTLIVATDGFSSHVKRADLVRQMPSWEFDELPNQLVDLVRLPTGDLWDDVGIVVCRKQPVEWASAHHDNT